MSTTVPEIGDLKSRLKETWMAGDYDRFSRYMEQGAFSTNNSTCPRVGICLMWFAAPVRSPYGRRAMART